MSKIDDNLLVDLDHSADFKKSPKGDLGLIKGKSNLRQALLHRLTTIKGSLAHRPTYGIGAQQFQGALSTVGQKRELALQIKEQFELEPRVTEVTGVNIIQDINNSSKFIVIVKYNGEGFEDETSEFSISEVTI